MSNGECQLPEGASVSAAAQQEPHSISRDFALEIPILLLVAVARFRLRPKEFIAEEDPPQGGIERGLVHFSLRESSRTQSHCSKVRRVPVSARSGNSALLHPHSMNCKYAARNSPMSVPSPTEEANPR